MTLNDLYPDWIACRQLEVSINTLEKNIRNWNRFFVTSDIITCPLPKLTRLYLKAWATNVVRSYSLTKKFYNSEVKSILNGLLDYAVDLEIIAINKFRSITVNPRVFRPAVIKDETEDVFTLEEEKRIMCAAELDAEMSGESIPLGICVLFCTGLRIGELCALKWGDIQDNVLIVSRMQVVHKVNVDGCIKTDGYKVVEHTKTSAGYRRVFLPDKALSYFGEIRRLNEQNNISIASDDFIFRRMNHYVTHQRDDLANSRVFDSRLRKYCKNLHLPYKKSSHDIRRTYISLLIESGMSIDAVRKLAGHENIDMTLHYVRNRLPAEEMARAIDDVFKDL